MANKIAYVKNDEPAFIKAFKEKVGYKEGPDIDTKKEVLQYEDEDRSDNEDEKPVVVVLKKGDLTAEEVEQELKMDKLDKTNKDNTEDNEPSEDGKIIFKKPTKRQGDSGNELQVSSSKKQKEEKKSKQSSSKQVKNCSLLSFGDDEEEEDT